LAQKSEQIMDLSLRGLQKRLEREAEILTKLNDSVGRALAAFENILTLQEGPIPQEKGPIPQEKDAKELPILEGCHRTIKSIENRISEIGSKVEQINSRLYGPETKQDKS